MSESMVKILVLSIAVGAVLIISGAMALFLGDQFGGDQRILQQANASLKAFRDKITWGCQDPDIKSKGSVDFTFYKHISYIEASDEFDPGGKYLVAHVCGKEASNTGGAAYVIRMPIESVNQCTKVRICQGAQQGGLGSDGAGEQCKTSGGAGGSAFDGEIWIRKRPGQGDCGSQVKQTHEFGLWYSGSRVTVDEWF